MNTVSELTAVTTMKSVKKRIQRRGRSIALSALLFTLLAIQPAAADDPSDVFEGAVNTIMGEITSIASIVLFAYGFFQVIKLGIGSDTSSAMKKIGLSWGIGIILAGWDIFMEFITEVGEDDLTDAAWYSLDTVEMASSHVATASTQMMDVIFLIM